MSSSQFRCCRKVVQLLFGVALILANVCEGQSGDLDLTHALKTLTAPFEAAHRKPPHTTHDMAVEQLAKEIDWLEHHVNQYGSIVAKYPDVWGEARLMRYRREYEEKIAEELSKFDVKLNAALYRSDQAFLAMAFALQAALGTRNGSPTPVPTVSETNNFFTNSNGMISASGEISRTAPFKMPAGLEGFKYSENELSLEPTIQLDQLSRYLNHLQELRRINEGDDIADSPGYAISLVRIPVSILTGSCTRKGYGAEITVIAQPNVTSDLLSSTFRDMVVNDLVNLLSPCITFLINDKPIREEYNKIDRALFQMQLNKDEKTTRDEKLFSLFFHEVQNRSKQLAQIESLFVARSPRSELPFPRSHVGEIFGENVLAIIVADATRRFSAAAPQGGNVCHLMDVQAYLREEIQAAYALMTADSYVDIWDQPVVGHYLANAVHEVNADEISRIRDNLFPGLSRSVETLLRDASQKSADTQSPRVSPVTLALGWAIVVEASLLNERLNQDVRDSMAYGSGIALGSHQIAFFHPNPSDEARQIFSEYVQQRWPIRVFALDPVAQDQNVADAFARRRELQIAAALAFASGRMNTQALMRFVRRLEWDMATIALNRTQIGFSHGNDTFGWRFYPRFQTPSMPGNLRAFQENLFGGPSADSDLSTRQLENGLRECIALVVAPSFVHSVIFDIRTNWFRLTNPSVTELSMREILELSRAVKAMQQSAALCAKCAHAYRDGEVERLLRRVEQLERQLPLQTMIVRMPYENTAGGFELFNRGITDLAPELIGWYGVSHINPCTPTTLYLMGNGFSMHDTHVIAGGKTVPFQLISRQVIEVTIPKDVPVFVPINPQNANGTARGVNICVATPYGISNRLLVPVVDEMLPQTSPQSTGTLSYQLAPVVKSHVCLSDTSGVEPTSYHFREDAIVIRLMRGSVPYQKDQTITFKARDTTRGVFIGKYSIRGVPLDEYNSEYRITGTALDILMTELHKIVTAYQLCQRGENYNLVPLIVDVSAELEDGERVDGSFFVEYMGKDIYSIKLAE